MKSINNIFKMLNLTILEEFLSFISIYRGAYTKLQTTDWSYEHVPLNLIPIFVFITTQNYWKKFTLIVCLKFSKIHILQTSH